MAGQAGRLTGGSVNVSKAPVGSCGWWSRAFRELEKKWELRIYGGMVKWWNMRNPCPELAGHNTPSFEVRSGVDVFLGSEDLPLFCEEPEDKLLLLFCLDCEVLEAQLMHICGHHVIRKSHDVRT